MISFQNCGQTYRPKELLGISSVGLNAHLSHNAGATTPLNQSVRFTVDGTGLDGATNVWGFTLNGATSGCQSVPLPGAVGTDISCGTPGELVVRVRVSVGNQTTTAESTIQISDEDPPPPPPVGSLVEFRIPAGTNNRSWNTAASPIVVFVGQTLRIYNDDSVAHAIHTNSAPFPHGDTIPAKTGTTAPSMEYSVTAPYSSDPPSGPLYDHIFQSVNPRPDIFIYSLDGAALYTSNCASCHGPLSASTKRGRTLQQISAAIGSVPAMSGLSSLSDRQRAAIAFALRLGSN